MCNTAVSRRNTKRSKATTSGLAKGKEHQNRTSNIELISCETVADCLVTARRGVPKLLMVYVETFYYLLMAPVLELLLNSTITGNSGNADNISTSTFTSGTVCPRLTLWPSRDSLHPRVLFLKMTKQRDALKETPPVLYSPV